MACGLPRGTGRSVTLRGRLPHVTGRPTDPRSGDPADRAHGFARSRTLFEQACNALHRAPYRGGRHGRNAPVHRSRARMSRLHAALVSLVLAVAAAAAALALLETTALGQPATKQEVATAAAVKKRSRQLDAWERSIAASLKARPRALPPVPRFPAVPVVRAASAASLPQPAAAPAAPAQSPRPRTAHAVQAASGRATTIHVAATAPPRTDPTGPSAPQVPASAPPPPPAAAPSPPPPASPPPPPAAAPESHESEQSAERQCEALKRAAEGRGEAAKQEAERACEALKGGSEDD